MGDSRDGSIAQGAQSLLKPPAKIVGSNAGGNSVPAEQLRALTGEIHAAPSSMDPGAPAPAVERM